MAAAAVSDTVKAFGSAGMPSANASTNNTKTKETTTSATTTGESAVVQGQTTAYQTVKTMALDGKVVRFEYMFPVHRGDKANRSTISRLVRMTDLRQRLSIGMTTETLKEYLALLFGLITSIHTLNSFESVIVRAHVQPVFPMAKRLLCTSPIGELAFYLQKMGMIVYWNGIFQLNKLLVKVFRVADKNLLKVAPEQAVTDANVSYQAFTHMSHIYAVFAEAYSGAHNRLFEVQWRTAYVAYTDMNPTERMICNRMHPRGVRSFMVLCGAVTDAVHIFDTISNSKRVSAKAQKGDFQYSKDDVKALTDVESCIRSSRVDLAEEEENLKIRALLGIIGSVRYAIKANLCCEEGFAEVAYSLMKKVAKDLFTEQRNLCWRQMHPETVVADDADIKHNYELTPEDKSHIDHYEAVNRDSGDGENGKNDDTEEEPLPASYLLHYGKRVEWPAFVLWAKPGAKIAAASMTDVLPVGD